MATLSLTNCMKETATAPDAVRSSYTIYADLDSDTKTVNDGLSTKWTEKDSINVFHVESGASWVSNNIKFVLTDAQTGQFETDAFEGELAEVNDWYVMYPYDSHVVSPYIEGVGYMPVASKVSAVQTQKGNDNMAHIAGPNYPMWGVATGVKSEDLPHVKMTHLTSLVEVEVTNSTDAPLVVNSVSLTASQDIVGTYYIDFSTETPAFENSGAQYVSNTAVLRVEEGSPIENGQTGKFYLAIKPYTENDYLTIKVNGLEKTVSVSELVFTPGKIKTVKFDFSAVPEIVAGPNTSNLKWVLGESAYDETAVLNNSEEIPVLKIGTGAKSGTANVAVPAGATKIGFYAVSWNERPAAVLVQKDGKSVNVFNAPVNEGAAGSSPFMLNVENPALCYFEMPVQESSSYTFTTTGDTRVIIWGLNYYDAEGNLGEEVTAEPEIMDVTIAEFLAAEVSDAVWYKMTGTIKNLVNDVYGNFDLVDETGSVYVYGLTATQVAKNDKSFASLELKEGDIVTLIGTRSDYKGASQVGGPAYYVSHIEGEEPVEPTPDGETFTWDLTIADYTVADEGHVAWYGDYSVMILIQAESSTVANNYIGGSTNNGNECVHTRMYKDQILTIFPVANYMPLKTVFTATSADYASKFVNSKWTNAEVVNDGKIVTVTPVDATLPVAVTISAATRFTDVTVHYVYDETFVPADSEEPEPEDPVEPEPDQPGDAIAVTVAEYLAAAEDDTLYELTGEIQNVKNTKYGNFDLVDETGSVYIYGLVDENGAYIFTDLGLKAGDTITIVGKRQSYNDMPEMVDALYISHEVGEEIVPEPEPEPDQPGEIVPATIAEVLAAEVDANVWYEITGKIVNLANTTYGNFDLMDETGSIYVYGLTATQVAKNDKSFESLGLKSGDVVTLIGTRADYNGTPQVGGPAYYVRHEAGADEPDVPAEGTVASAVFAEMGYENAQVVADETIMIDNNVSLVFSQGAASTAPAYYNSGSAIRMYQNGSTLEVSASGKTITSIEVTFSSGHYYMEPDCGEFSAESAVRTWTGEAETVLFTSTGTDKNHRAYVSAIKVTYAD